MSRQLKQELIFLRKRAALKPGLDPLRNCARCLTELGRILNRGALCPVCLKKVCKDCRHYGDENHEWLCIYCHKQMQLKAISGEWMYDFSRSSMPNRVKDSPSDELRKALHDTQRKGLLSGDVTEPAISQLPVETPPEKPPRIFTYEPPSQSTFKEALNQNTHSKNSECSHSDAEKTSSDQQKDSRQSSPRLPKSPWSDIDTDPTLPARIDKSRPLGGGFQNLESFCFKERQSSDEGLSITGYRSRSMSSDVMDESDSLTPVPLPRKRMSPLKKQQAIPDQNPVDNQQSSVDTTDSGVYSPGMKTELSLDTNPPASPLAISRLSSNEQESIDSPSLTHCLASESSLSETDDDRRQQAKISGGFFRKRKSVIAEDKRSATSTDTQLVLPPLGLSHTFSHYNICFNTFFHTNFKQKLIGSYLNFSNSSNYKSNACREQINNKNNFPRSNFQLSSKACALDCNIEALGNGGNTYSNYKELKSRQQSVEQAGVKNKRKSRRKNYLLQLPHLRRKRNKKKEYEIHCSQQQTEDILNTSNLSNYDDDYFSKHNIRNTLVRSVSLPSYKTSSGDWLKPWLWKSHSLEEWLWCLEEHPCPPRDFNEIFNTLPDDYKLVYVSSASSSSDSDSMCDSDSATTDSYVYETEGSSKPCLKVNSHIKINYGTSYIEDSDWELESEDSVESDSLGYLQSDCSLNEANNFLISYALGLHQGCYENEKYSSPVKDSSENAIMNLEEKKICVNINELKHSLNSPVIDIRFLKNKSYFKFHKSKFGLRKLRCTNFSTCQEIKLRKGTDKLSIPVFKETVSSWPRLSCGRPNSHSLFAPSSSFMNIDREKPVLTITHPQCLGTNLQLQLIRDSTSLNSFLSLDELLTSFFRRETCSERVSVKYSNFQQASCFNISNVSLCSSDDPSVSFPFPVRVKTASFPRPATCLKIAFSVSPEANLVSFSRESNSVSSLMLLNSNEAVISFVNVIDKLFEKTIFRDDPALIFKRTMHKKNHSTYDKSVTTINSFRNSLELYINLNLSANFLAEIFKLFTWKSRTFQNDILDSRSWWRDCCEGKVGNWLQLDDANAFHYTAFPLSSYATNRGNDNSATGWGKRRCCIAVATEQVIDLNLRALVSRREVVLDSVDLTPYLGRKAGTEDKLRKSANLVNAFLYQNPPVFPKPEADHLFSLTRSELYVLFQRLFDVKAETRMIAAKSEVTGVSSFDKTDHDTILNPDKTQQNCQEMHFENLEINTEHEKFKFTRFSVDSSWISKSEETLQLSKSDSGSRADVNKQRSAFLSWPALESADNNKFSFRKQVIDDFTASNKTCDHNLKVCDIGNVSNECDKDDSCEFLDAEILPCIKNFFSSELENEEFLNCNHNQFYVPSVLSDHADNVDRVDCQCNKPCEVPSSPSVVDATVERHIADDGEIFSSGDELDKFESDTDSQDTVIEGEAYKRIRSVAIKEKILLANEELFGSNSKKTFFNSQNSTAFDNNLVNNSEKADEKVKMCSLEERQSKISPQSFLSSSQYSSDMPELPLFSDSEESDSLTPFSSLEKHFQALKNPCLPNYNAIPSSFQKHKPVESSEPCERPDASSYSSSFNETAYSSESSDNGSDGEEVILSDTSTSSDEATYIAPTTSFQYFAHPMSYKLHTIAEESCEESERSSRNSNPLSRSCSDFEYFDKTRLSLVKSSRKNSRKPVLPDNSILESNNELKNSKGSDIYAVLATSRLEKYFKSNLQDGEKVNYPDDELTDASGEVSSDEDVTTDRLIKLSAVGRRSESQSRYSKSPSSSSGRVYATVKCNRLGSSLPSKNFNADSKVFQLSEMKNDLNASKSNMFSKSESCVSESKQNKAVEQVSDDEAKYIMNHLMQHITNNSENKSEASTDMKDMTPMLKILESEIARLMLTVSPASLSAGEPSSSCSSTIGSNNSDYGSDTLESAEESTSEEDLNADIVPENRPVVDIPVALDSVSTSQSEGAACNSDSVSFVPTSDPAVSEETLYICKQLMASLKKIADSTEGACASDNICIGPEDHSAKQYITDQIVSLMQTVNASQNNSPLLRRLSSNSSALQIDSDVSQDRSDSDSPPPNDEKREHSKSKTPSESGSETTISASISIPSYDDSDRTPTESEISHEMDELYALLESSSASQDIMNSARFSYDLDNHSFEKSVPSRNADSPVSEDDFNFAFSDSCDNSNSECSLLHGAASKLESLLPISIEERIARYKDAFLNKADFKDQEIKTTETRINVILPQPSMPESVCDDTCVNSSSLPLNLDSVFNVKSGEKLSAMKSCDNILSSCSVYKSEENNYNITSVKIVSHNTYPPSSAIHKILSNNIDSTYTDQQCDYNVVNVCDVLPDETATSDEILNKDSYITDDGDADQCTGEEKPAILSPLPKVINPKEKASSENDLLVANYRTKSKGSKVFGTKSVGNICELENINNKSTFRDTGYYSFKSSEESFLSLDDSTASQTSTASLTQYRSLTSTETIPEEEESSAKGTATTKMSLSSSNIPDAVSDNSPSKSNTLPLSLRSKISSTSNVNHRTRSSFFSTSGVLRKLTLLRDESGNSLRSSPHGRLRMRNRSLSGGSEDGRQRKTPVPQISVSECLESQCGRLSTASSERDSSGVQDEDPDQHFTYPSRSQMSLSSFGGRSESVTSVYSAAGGGRYGTVIVTGDVLFGLNYNYKNGTLEINVKECRNLAAVDTKKNRSDPYVKVYLLPDRTKGGKRKTKVKKHTLNPVFDEVLKFQVTVSELEIRTLWLSVWHSDRFGRNDFLGEVMLPLANDAFESSGLKWHPLQERLETLDPPVSYKGDLILALKYVPPDVTSRKFSKKPGVPVKGALEVLVREARNLMATRSNGTSDPFCKSYLLPDKSKAGKQKTPVFKKSCNPKWNHTFLYDDVSLDDLRERCLELTIWDYDKITSNDFLGGVRLCLGTGKYQGRDVDWMDSVGEERSLWYTMLERPNTWVDGSLLLRSTMQSRRTV